MSETTNGAAGTYKTLGLRVPNDLHSQVTLVAKLDGISLQDACVRGVAMYVEKKQSEPDFKARVARALEEIEREAAGRKNAIQALLGQPAQAAGDTPAKKTTTASRRPGRKS